MKPGNSALMSRKRKSSDEDKQEMEFQDETWNRAQWTPEGPHRNGASTLVDDAALRGELTFDDAPPFEGAFIDREASDTLDPVEVPETVEASEAPEAVEGAEEAVLQYIRTFDLPSAVAQGLYQQALARLAERELAAERVQAIAAEPTAVRERPLMLVKFLGAGAG